MSKEIRHHGVSGAAGLLALLVLAGCGTSAGPGDQKRAASFQPFANLQMGGVDVTDFIQARTAMIVAGVALEAGKNTQDGDTTLASYRFPSHSPGPWSRGSATAIDPRGYFMTAAHCIEPEPLTLIYLDRDTMKLAPNVRVVWRGNPKAGEPDLAVLCIGRPIRVFFEWTAPPPDGTAVIASGMNGNLDSEVNELQSTAGKVLDTIQHEGKTPAASFDTICHEAPVRAGDSGGPLITREGKLIAVTTDRGIAALRPISPPGFAMQPNLPWLQSLIDADAAAHPGQSP